MEKIEPKYRKQLNDGQLEILELLYRFRFGSRELIVESLGKYGSDMFRRLRVLEEQGFVGKHFASSYRLQGKPAAYYLLPKGGRVLKERQLAEDKALKLIYKDKTASEQFIGRSLTLFEMSLQLQACYGETLGYTSKSELAPARFDYFPQPLPDAYIGLEEENLQRDYLLEYFEFARPLVVMVGRVKRLLEYADSNQWEAATKDELPAILLVCDTPTQQKRLQKRLAGMPAVDRADTPIYTTTRSAVATITDDDRIWQASDEPDDLRSLPEL